MFELLYSDPFFLLIIFAFMAGLVDAISGGGGLILLPALLTAGVPPHLSLGTNKLAATLGSLTAAQVCIRKGIIQPRLWRLMAMSTLIGALLGTLTVWFISSNSMKKALPLIIVLAAIYVLFAPHKIFDKQKITSPQNQPKSAVLGVSLGFYDGFIGPGTGAFWLSLTMWLYRVDIVTASGIARVMNFISNFISLLTFLLLGSVDFKLGIGLGVALMLGAYIGVHSALRFGAAFIRPVFISFVLLVTLRLIWLEWVMM